MPIRLNLLAEAQAAEDLRRRDPVKRALWAGALLTAAVLAWGSLLQLRVALEKGDLANYKGEIQRISEDYETVVASQKKLGEATQKLTALRRLTASRFLSGNLLNALQQAPVDDVQVVRMQTSFNYTLTEATKTKTNGSKVVPGKPATSAERIVVDIEAKDASANPGDQVNAFKENLASLSYFKDAFAGGEQEVRLTGLNPPQTNASGRPFVLFTVECPFPEKVR